MLFNQMNRGVKYEDLRRDNDEFIPINNNMHIPLNHMSNDNLN